MSFPYTGLPAGKRVAVFGRSGVGKSYLSKWIVLRARSVRWCVLDTKHDPEFDDWPAFDELPSAAQLRETWQEASQIVIRPKPIENNEATLDMWLEMLHERFNNFGIVIDETYQAAYGQRAGPGFTGLVTRGRVRGQSIVMGSQRPAWVPRFVFTEAIGFCIMSLNLLEDRERVARMVGDRWRRQVLRPLKERQWLWYDVARDRLTEMSAVTILDIPVIVDDPAEREIIAS